MQDDDDTKSKSDYDVGYGKPPKSGQFKPGRSGNKKGRPKASKNIKTLVNDILSERIEITEAGKKKQVPKAEALVRKTFAQAMKGDARARNMLVELHNPDDPNAPRQEDLTDIELADVQEYARRMGLMTTPPSQDAQEDRSEAEQVEHPVSMPEKPAETGENDDDVE